jgi:WD40 repeat protein
MQCLRTKGLHFNLVFLLGLYSGCIGQGCEGHIQDAVLSPDGEYFAQSTGFGIIIYEVETGKKAQELNGGAASQLKFSTDSKYLASGGLTELTLWDWAGGKRLASWKGTNRYSFKMDFSHDGSLLAARDNPSLRVWETAMQKLVLTIPMPHEMDCLAFSPDGKMLAVAGTETKEKEPRFHEIKLWEVSSGKLLGILKGPEYCFVKSLAFSADGDYLATGLSIQEARMWAVRTRKEVWKQHVGNVDYDILAFSPDGKQLVVGGFQSLSVLDVAKGKVIKKHELPGSAMSSLTISMKPARLLIAKKNSVYSIDIDSGKVKRLFPK